ncbi:conserved hypothetical protein [Cupriavidus necator]|uniref:Uncharacterized protein n=1 Tax=Cupriavidus necator TaxID=106590 RepID=A0A1K0IBA5_CUPNE|nr:conserved hypothetical protein [Cupriavidus necator]
MAMGLQKKTDPEQAQADSAASRHTPMMQQYLLYIRQGFLAEPTLKPTHPSASFSTLR